jgi:hypothetical protein
MKAFLCLRLNDGTAIAIGIPLWPDERVCKITIPALHTGCEPRSPFF